MSRCTCTPWCRCCGDGPCDCSCTEEQLAQYDKEEAAREIARKKIADWKQGLRTQLENVGIAWFTLTRNELAELMSVDIPDRGPIRDLCDHPYKDRLYNSLFNTGDYDAATGGWRINYFCKACGHSWDDIATKELTDTGMFSNRRELYKDCTRMLPVVLKED